MLLGTRLIQLSEGMFETQEEIFIRLPFLPWWGWEGRESSKACASWCVAEKPSRPTTGHWLPQHHPGQGFGCLKHPSVHLWMGGLRLCSPCVGVAQGAEGWG